MDTATPRLLVGRYRLHSPLGQGGMGTVWRATDELLHQDVAIKEVRLPPELDESERAELRERMLREARAAARLRSHPSIVTVLDVVVDDGRPWIIMELVRARSLHQMIREHGPMPAPQVARIGLSLLDALSAAHRAGILHRDVKPSNVLITPEGGVVLTDFGIASLSGDATLTHTGGLTGSPGFIAPERLRGEGDRPESDLWSLGATLYTAVEGRAPYHRERLEAMFTAPLLYDPDPMRLAGPLSHVLSGLLDKDPARRLSADEAAWHLRAITAAPDAPPGPPPPYGPPPQGHASPTGPTFPPHPTDATVPGGGRPTIMALVGAALAVVLLAAAGLTVWRVWDSGQGSNQATGGTTGETTGTTTGTGGGGTTPPPTAIPTQTGKAVYAQEPRACDMLTDAQAASLLGGPAKRQFSTRGACYWQTTSGPFISVTIVRLPDDNSASQTFDYITRTTFEEEVERNPSTVLRKGRPAVGAQGISYRRAESFGHISYGAFRLHNLIVYVYLSQKSAGFAKLDQAAAILTRRIDAAR
ncbi:serine/threonine-protein kinase [Thermopolyspora sp. NPDC052614]|uniref:serine/threonine-protein kinase n=1 Tax=Thermopolyspora sp. NPDC052614 TaxID=3155682 RepID=UPI0034444A4C